jgi:hypothetical protein
MPPITRGLSRTRKIWIGVALCRAARGRSIALRQCCKAAVDVVASEAVGLQANRETWTVGLSPRRRGCRKHSYYQNRKRQSTHPGRAFPWGFQGRDLARTFLFPTADARCMGGLTFACACNASCRVGQKALASSRPSGNVSQPRIAISYFTSPIGRPGRLRLFFG